MTKFFESYTRSDPTDVTLNSLNVDTSNTLTVQGQGKTYASVAKLARALAAASATGVSSSAPSQPYFTNVQITQVGGNSGKGVTFSIAATLQSGATSDNQ